jgi:hypothetical protein
MTSYNILVWFVSNFVSDMSFVAEFEETEMLVEDEDII